MRFKTAVVALLVMAVAILGLLWWRSYTADDGVSVYYLAADSKDITQLFQFDLADETTHQMTASQEPVTGFAVSPNGEHLAFTTSLAAAELGEETIWLMRNGRTPQPLLTCTDAACHHLVWAPDGRRLIYERRALDENGIPTLPRIWWLDTVNGDTVPVLEEDTYAAAPRLSPDGAWIAYVSPADEGVWLYHFADGRSHFIASVTGTPVAWNPDSQSLLYSALNPVALPATADEHSEEEHSHANTATHLFLFDLTSGRSRQLSADVVIEDSAPTWSSDGAWIAFGRRQVRTGSARQLWLMRADGSDAHPLSADPAWNVGPPNWSGDGRFLLFQRFNLNDPQAEPGIWLLEIATGNLRELVSPGFLPAWQ
ncbi:MAG: PD40 domain-containing protein [Ardenticatenaceae bacterium]|nr:PD40 domain-containing protein [Anaerolineales bacterium]MCB8922112.1 PD40 domain-containing protein [Ardenticatenaceae bacterium]MCB9003228.1 PD40 domain-containing protein [Ardenticatenaceae bacterium]